MNIASGLAYVPISHVPVYCATKAFVKSFTLSLRHQLQKSSIIVIEVSPPLVDTDLHRHAENPDGYSTTTNKAAISQEEFIKDVMEGLNAGQEEVGAGFVKGSIKTWRDAFGTTYDRMNPKQ